MIFAPGQSINYISFNIADDTEIEPDELVLIELNNSANCMLGDYSTMSFTIHDDDAKRLLTIGNYTTNRTRIDESVSEPIIFDISVSSVDYNNPTYFTCNFTGDAEFGVDYLFEPDTFEIPAGVASKSIEISIVNDKELETDEEFTISINPVSNAAEGITHKIRIDDDESDKSINFLNSDTIFIDENYTGGVAFSLTTSQPDFVSNIYFNVSFSGTAVIHDGTNNGDFYVENWIGAVGEKKSMLIEAGSFISETLYIHPRTDGNNEGDQTIVLNLSNVQNAQIGELFTKVIVIKANTL